MEGATNIQSSVHMKEQQYAATCHALHCTPLLATPRYALVTYPWVKVQFIVYGEDKGMIEAAGAGEPLPIGIAKEAQARWSSFSNVVWCIANDVGMELAINSIGAVMSANEPWGTLITSWVPRVAKVVRLLRALLASVMSPAAAIAGCF